ncbi:MAG: hypothetical protein MUC65_03260 [Pontiellaceae bacterium]|jgi:hypothetical protein|nr:hypothetical protein [Pontiellaceae bacterium]
MLEQLVPVIIHMELENPSEEGAIPASRRWGSNSQFFKIVSRQASNG